MHSFLLAHGIMTKNAGLMLAELLHKDSFQFVGVNRYIIPWD